MAAAPQFVMTKTFTLPDVRPDGLVEVICVAEFTVKLAGVPSKVTAATFVKLLPVMTTLVPPDWLPEVVPSEVIVGREHPELSV